MSMDRKMKEMKKKWYKRRYFGVFVKWLDGASNCILTPPAWYMCDLLCYLSPLLAANGRLYAAKDQYTATYYMLYNSVYNYTFCIYDCIYRVVFICATYI